MLYIWELSNKFDLNQTTRVLHNVYRAYPIKVWMIFQVRKFFFVSLIFHLLFTLLHTTFVLRVYSGKSCSSGYKTLLCSLRCLLCKVDRFHYTKNFLCSCVGTMTVNIMTLDAECLLYWVSRFVMLSVIMRKVVMLSVIILCRMLL